MSTQNPAYVVTHEQCPVGCAEGACESCPCCGAGWCVFGIEGIPEDGPDRVRWAEVAAEYNPVAKALADATGLLRRAPVQADEDHPRGTVAWHEHERAWRAYAAIYGTAQSAERIAERHGFGYREMAKLLGVHYLETWEQER